MNQTDPLSNLADIEMPAPPDWWPVIIAAIVATLIIVTLGLFIRHMIKGKNNQRDSSIMTTEQGHLLLDQLEKEWRQGKVNDREASYQLSTLLRLGLGLPQLTPHCPASLKTDTSVWEETIMIFNQLRYKKMPQTQLTPDIFKKVSGWLGKG